MKVTRREVAQRINDYLHHRITLAELVDWAERVMMEGDFDEHDYETLLTIHQSTNLPVS